MTTENTLREIVGVLTILLHFGMLLLLALLWSSSGFTFDEFTTTAAILAPLLAAHTTTIVGYFNRERFQVKDRSRTISWIFATLSLGLPVAFAVAISASLVFFAKGWTFSNFEQFKATFAIIEVAFASYVAATTNTLFKQSSTPEVYSS